MRILLDEGWLQPRDRLQALGHEVVTHHVGQGQGDRLLANRAIAEDLLLITRDRDFQRLWASMGRRFTCIYVQPPVSGGGAPRRKGSRKAGGKNHRWPELLDRALAYLADPTHAKALVSIKSNRLRAESYDGAVWTVKAT